jgi:DNA-binding GntR family transcriptional regulator
LRASLEGSAISSLKDRYLTELCRTLMARLQLMEAHWSNKDRDRYFRENVEFHQNIINFTENQPLIRVLHIANDNFSSSPL